jgi:hypothetical protein
MQRITTNPVLVRFVVWLVVTVLTVGAFLFWSGGFNQLLEYINDFF